MTVPDATPVPSLATIDDRPRCHWSGATDPRYVAYHDREWGVPLRDERRLFELVVLEGAQAGLSWATILNRRDGYRRAFAGFDVRLVAAFDDGDVDRLLADPGIIRNRVKIQAAIGNARAVLDLEASGSSLGTLLWSFVGGRQRRNAWSAIGGIPAETAESQAMSRELRVRGFRFVGPTICYALMQSAGLVNDHETGCFRYPEIIDPA